MSPSSTSAIEWFGAAVVVASAAMLSFRRFRPAIALGGGAAVLTGSILAPISHSSLFAVAISVLGAPSAASVVLLPALVIAGTIGSTTLFSQCRIVAAAVLLLAAALYPMALGLGAFDPYRLGYSGWALPLASLVLLAIAWLRSVPLMAIWIGAAALLNLSGFHPSLNYWDHLIDPVGTIAAIGLVFHAVFAGRRAAMPVAAPAK